MDCAYAYLVTTSPLKPLKQAGTSLVEFSVVAIPLLLLGMGSIEISLWFFTKQAVSLALLEAGRAAIVAHAHPHTIEKAFELAIQPLFIGNSKLTTTERLQAALQQRQLKVNGAPWQIEVLSPLAADFADFHQTQLQVPGAAGLAIINNHYLAEQDQNLQQLGWQAGLGTQSGRTIFQANTLVLRLSWLHQPVVPGVSGLMRMLGNTEGSYSQRAMALGGFLPIKQELALVMQSHPVNWPASTNGKVVGPPKVAISNNIISGQCTGIWCIRTLQNHAGPNDNSPPVHTETNLVSGDIADNKPTWSPPGSATQENPELLPDLLIADPNHPACGISMCCVV